MPTPGGAAASRAPAACRARARATDGEPPPVPESRPVLTLRDICKRFQGVRALEGVSFDLRPGEVHALMGENGAGKSTLMKIAAGLFRPDSGSIRIAGAEAVLRRPADATARGIHTVFQELCVLPNLDVGHNILIGEEPARAGGLWLDRRELYARAQAVLDRWGIALDARTPAARLSTGARQMVEIARACAGTPRALILDEPTSSLGRHEEETLFSLIARLKAEGVGIVYITHRMSEVFRLSDRITVLRDGRHVVTGPASAFDRDGLIRAMVGRPVDERPAAAAAAARPVVLAARGVARPPRVMPTDIELRAGEVTGLGGLMGAGRSELARLLAGVDRPAAGRMELDGRPFAPAGVAAAVRAGVAYVPEDRKTLGLVLTLSVADNLALPNLPRLSRLGWVAPARVTALARDWMGRLGIKAASPAAGVATLSGGNQQKVALARWMATLPRVILLDEPTRGVDVGAKAEIHRLVRALAAEGAAVLVISSELPELLAVCDRILVMARGRLAGELAAAEASEERLLALAFAEPGEAA